MGAVPTDSEKSAEALSDVIKRVERDHISQTLQRFQGDHQKTADALGIDSQTLQKKIKELGI
jgi:DNA-binding NtrC family response regulator